MDRSEGATPLGVLAPFPQTVWGGPAVVNFTCGGAGAGAVLAILATALVAPLPSLPVRAVEVIGVLLAGIGLAAVAVEAGRPLRGLNVFRHFRRSWMSREALAAVFFGGLIVLDVVVPGPWQRGLGIAAGFLFMLSQGFILFAAKGVPAWATWELPILFLTSGLTKGLGVVMVLLAAFGATRALVAAGELAVGMVLLDVLAWWAYAESPDGPPGKEQALRRLRSPAVAAGILGLGHALPLVLLAVWLGVEGPSVAALGRLAAILSGAGMVAGGTILKWALVRKAGLLYPVGFGAQRH